MPKRASTETLTPEQLLYRLDLLKERVRRLEGDVPVMKWETRNVQDMMRSAAWTANFSLLIAAELLEGHPHRANALDRARWKLEAHFVADGMEPRHAKETAAEYVALLDAGVPTPLADAGAPISPGHGHRSTAGK